MKKLSRRQFIRNASQAGAAVAVASAAGRFGISQTQSVTRVVIDSDRQIAPIMSHCSVRFWNSLGARSTRASTSRARNLPTARDSAPM